MSRAAAITISLMLFLGLSACVDHPNHHVDGSYDGCDCSQTAKDLAWSLDNEKSQWETDGYRLSRNWFGPVIWVANDASGLHAGPHGTYGEPWKPRDDKDKDMLWRAVQRWCAWRLSGK